MPSTSRLSRFIHFPVTRIILSLAAVITATLLVQSGTQAILTHIPFSDDYKKLVVAVLVAATALVTYICLFKIYEKRAIEELSTSHFWRNSIAGFFIGFLFLSFVILIMYFGKAYTILSLNPISFLVPALALGISSAVFEEILFRGIIFRITEEKLGTIWALILSSSFFGIAHLANPNSTMFSAIAITVEAGLLLGTAYIYSKNLWLPIFIHFAWNFSEGGIYGAIISGNGLEKSLITSKIDGPDLLTGGAFGPENSLQAVILGLMVSILFIWMANKQHKIAEPFWNHSKISNLERL